MQISLKWVSELVDLETISLEDLIEKLTLGGFEVEEILEIEIENEKTIGLEISTTANRSDSLSIQGIALEIAALLQKPLKTSNYIYRTFEENQKIQQLTQNSLLSNDCSEFKAVTIENLTNFESPKWLKEKLIASGISPENNLIDFQNYIVLETGYPLDVYDLDKIQTDLRPSQFQLSLTNAKEKEQFLANNGITYELNDSISILKANDIPISITGIISHQNYNYSKKTKSLLVEGSIFTAAKIRQQSRTLGLRTTRSIRYEKSLNHTNLLNTISRFIDLVRISNPNLVCKIHTNSSVVEQKAKTLELHYENVKEILGPVKGETDQAILPSTITTILEQLQFQVEYNTTTNSWNVNVPEFRQNDIEQEIDLIEEVGRLYGFNNFLTRLPSLTKTGTEDFAYQIRKKITAGLIGSGLNELIQYSLVPETTYLKNEVQLINPLVKDYANLRVSLLPNLIKAIEENTKKGNSGLEGFEYGHVFSNSKSKMMNEYESVAGIFGGSLIKSDWSDSSHFLTWFEGKSKLEDLLKKLNLITYWQFYKPLREKNILHPYRTAEVYLANQSKLGIFGQIHPLLAKQLNISSKIYLFELNFELIKEQIQKNKVTIYQEYSSYPKVIKDLSFIIHQDIAFQDLKEILYLNGSKFLTEINLLDEYRGSSIPVDHTSLCIQFVFQSDQETLKNKKIEKILDHLKSLLVDQFKVVMRT
jgi:phenylalanyl-tRNA synthetase beta chain